MVSPRGPVKMVLLMPFFRRCRSSSRSASDVFTSTGFIGGAGGGGGIGGSGGGGGIFGDKNDITIRPVLGLLGGYMQLQQ